MERADADIMDDGDGYGYHENNVDFWSGFSQIASKVPEVVTSYMRKTLLPRMRCTGNGEYAVTMLDKLAQAHPDCVKPIAAEVREILASRPSTGWEDGHGWNLDITVLLSLVSNRD